MRLVEWPLGLGCSGWWRRCRVCHVQGNGKVQDRRVERWVKQGNGEISMTKKVKTETARTNYV